MPLFPHAALILEPGVILLNLADQDPQEQETLSIGAEGRGGGDDEGTEAKIFLQHLWQPQPLRFYSKSTSDQGVQNHRA